MKNIKFTYPTLGDNTKENREFLENIGYKMHGDYRKHNDFIFAFQPIDAPTPMYKSLYEHEIKLFYINEINCIGNNILFKSIAAINNDNDYMQWFICNRTGKYVLYRGKDLFKENISPFFHKATIEELKEHFKI